MAFRTQKISQMTPKGADLEATDLIEVSTIESGSYVTRSITGQELIDAIPLPPTGLTIGTTPIASGTIGRVLFQGTGNVLQQSSSLFWDSTNNRLGIGTSSPAEALDVVGRLKGTTSAAGSMFSLAGVNNTSLSVANDSSGRAFIEVKGNTAATSAAGAYFTADGYQESWFNVISREAATNNKIWRFGNLGQSNYFGIQKLNDAANSILSNALIIFSSTSNIGINTTTDAGFKLDVNGTARVTTLTTTNLNSPSGTETIFIRNSGGTTAGRIFPDGSTFRMSSASGLNSLGIYNSGNIGINTTTDAGFKLDVNGTARVSSNFQANANVIFGTSNGFYWDSANQRLGLGTNSPQVVFHIQTGTSEKLRLETSGTIGNFVTFYNSGVRKGYLGRSSSNDDLVYFNEAATGNLIFGSNGTERMRIKSNGVINMSAIPTSSAGLSAGDLWNDGGTLKIV
jgi:hypothetical protein